MTNSVIYAKAFFDIQLQFAHTVTGLSGLPLARALLEYTIEDATRVAPDQAHLQPGVATGFFGYGYQVWIFPGERRMFAFLGVRGQAIFVDPASRLVMVHTAVRKQPGNDPGNREAVALWQTVVRQLGG